MKNLYLNFRVRLALAVAGWLNRLLPDQCPSPVVAVVIGEVFYGKQGDTTIHVVDHSFVNNMTEEELMQMLSQQGDFADQMQEEYGYKAEEPVKMLN